jgi:hypothetical protein
MEKTHMDSQTIITGKMQLEYLLEDGTPVFLKIPGMLNVMEGTPMVRMRIISGKMLLV